MSGKGRGEDKCIANAVAFKIRCQGASIPEAMHATKFTLKESEDTAKQMAVRRAYQKAVTANSNAPSAVLVNRSLSLLLPLTDTVVASSAAAATSVSSMRDSTTPRSPCTPSVVVPQPKEKQIQKTARAMQKHCVNKLAKSEHMKSALKRASTWYTREQDKSDGLSSYEIARRVKKKFDGIGPHATTIRKYVNANIAGMSLVELV
jgi:hypothetical protein